jgi:hypothetical protein
MKLGEIAVKWGLIGGEDLERCLQYQRHLACSNAPLKLGQILVKMDLVSTRQLVALLDVQKKIRRAEGSDEEADEPAAPTRAAACRGSP